MIHFIHDYAIKKNLHLFAYFNQNLSLLKSKTFFPYFTIRFWGIYTLNENQKQL